MALFTLNPVRLVSFEFKAPAPSITRRSAPARPEPALVAAARSEPPQAAAAPVRIEPMLLLHQEQAKTMRLVAGYVARAVRSLRKQ